MISKNGAWKFHNLFRFKLTKIVVKNRGPFAKEKEEQQRKLPVM